jgi:hypothetical protein
MADPGISAVESKCSLCLVDSILDKITTKERYLIDILKLWKSQTFGNDIVNSELHA